MTARPDVRSAFTLIELLVVISIIALLISILLPALRQARSAGQSAQCLSNQRQIAIAMATYQNDHDGFYPHYYVHPTHVGGSMAGFWWPNLMYRKGYAIREMFNCPSMLALGGEDLSNAADNTSSLAWSHYGFNYYYLGSSLYTGSATSLAFRYGTPARQEEVMSPSQTILTVDNFRLDLYNLNGSFRGYCTAQPTVHPSHRPHARHMNTGVLNVAWADSHVSSVQVAEPFNPYPELTNHLLDDPHYWDRE